MTTPQQATTSIPVRLFEHHGDSLDLIVAPTHGGLHPNPALNRHQVDHLTADWRAWGDDTARLATEGRWAVGFAHPHHGHLTVTAVTTFPRTTIAPLPATA